MLEVTGLFKGEQVRDELVSAHDLIDFFELPIDTDKEILELQILPSQYSKFPQNSFGEKRSAIQRMKQSLIRGSHKGQPYVVRYYNSKTPKPGAVNDYNYSPRHLNFRGNTQVIRIPDEIEVAVMLVLNPACEESPFKKPNSIIEYAIVDNAKIAQEGLLLGARKQEITNLILQTRDELKLINLAHGLKIKGVNPISSKEASNPGTARLKLYHVAQKHPDEVAMAWSNNAVVLNGSVRNAASKGYVVPRPLGAGVVSWMWDESYGGGEICRVAQGMDAISTLAAHVSRPENYQGFMQRLNGIISETGEVEINVSELEKTGMMAIDTVVDDNNPMMIIMKAHNLDLLYLDRVNDRIFVIGDDGKPQGTAISVVQSWEHWKLELVNKGAVAMNRIKSAILAHRKKET